MSKIGIVTWYDGNYGSILQAFALQKTIMEMGKSCEIIKHHVNGDIRMKLKYKFSHQGLMQTIEYYLNKVCARLDVHKHNNEVLKRSHAFEEFINKELCLSKKAYGNSNYHECQQYEYYICGSDQIWNPSFTFFSSFYWLGFVKNAKKIAYAPSMGTTPLNDIEKQVICKYLSTFDAISVREEGTAKILNGIIKSDKVDTVIDPTMLIEADVWRKYIPSKSIEQKYLFAYLIRGSKEQRDYIKAVAAEKGLVLVVYPYLEGNKIEDDEKKWGDVRCFGDTPFDFLEKIYNASMIITDSFHCSVFSLLFHKNFYVLKKTNDITSQFGRLEQLLCMCSEEKRIIQPQEKRFEIIEDDFINADMAINKIRNSSLEFLHKNIN